MAEIKGFGLLVCLLMVLMAYLKQMLPRGKTMLIMRSVITLFILLSVVEGIQKFDFGALESLVDISYSKNEDVWDQASDAVANGLLHEFNGYLADEGVQCDVITVEVHGDQAGFKVNRVVLMGSEVGAAKNLIAARYQIGLSDFEVMYE